MSTSPAECKFEKDTLFQHVVFNPFMTSAEIKTYFNLGHALPELKRDLGVCGCPKCVKAFKKIFSNRK